MLLIKFGSYEFYDMYVCVCLPYLLPVLLVDRVLPGPIGEPQHTLQR